MCLLCHRKIRAETLLGDGFNAVHLHPISNIYGKQTTLHYNSVLQFPMLYNAPCIYTYKRYLAKLSQHKTSSTPNHSHPSPMATHPSCNIICKLFLHQKFNNESFTSLNHEIKQGCLSPRQNVTEQCSRPPGHAVGPDEMEVSIPVRPFTTKGLLIVD